jgi:hypothetical protein
MSVHEPSVMQQATLGCTHSFGAQVEPGPCGVPVQSIGSTTVHVPSGMQQATGSP